MLIKKLFTLLFLCIIGIVNAQAQVIVNSIVPNSGENCETLPVFVSGGNLGQFSGFTSLSSSLEFTEPSSGMHFYGNVNFSYGSQLLADVTIPSHAPPGWYDVVVYNPYAQGAVFGILSNGFEVIASTSTATMILGNSQTILQSTETYSVSQVLGSTFTWFVDNLAGIILSGQGTNSINLQWGNNAGTYNVCVVETNGLGCILDTLCLSVNVGPSSNIEDYNLTNKKLVKITDALGRETNPSKNTNTTLFYIYDDGTIKKQQFIE
jgi:hypothetical protein